MQSRGMAGATAEAEAKAKASSIAEAEGRIGDRRKDRGQKDG